jgi:DNA-binding MarR family transcriptional regulator
MMESSPSGGWRLCQQVLARVRPSTGQERRVLERLYCAGDQSIQSLRETDNTGEESTQQTVSRLEDKGFAYVRDRQHIELTDSGAVALEVILR